MDAVILAGGRGSRVRDLVPEFHKPLMQVDGKPLVVRSVELALNAGVNFPVVVAAPDNVSAICQAIDGLPAHVVVQRYPFGPGHALLLGLQFRPHPVIDGERVLVLLSDNVTTDDDVNAVSWHTTAVGVRMIERADAQRYTRLDEDCWVEKTPISDLDGPPLPCWVGPFIGWRYKMTRVLSRFIAENVSDGEVPIGPFLDDFMHTGRTIVEVSSVDVGTVSEYRRRTA